MCKKMNLDMCWFCTSEQSFRLLSGLCRKVTLDIVGFCTSGLSSFRLVSGVCEMMTLDMCRFLYMCTKFSFGLWCV